MKNVVIVGGGITGLSTAYYLNRKIKAEGLPINLKLIEAGERLGGKIETVHRDGFTIERGPDSFLARKEAALHLIQDLNMDGQLIRNATGRSYVLVDRKLHPIPKGFFMGVPLKKRALLKSKLFSTKGKLRALMDLTKGKSKPKKDQPLGIFLRHRFGDELIDRLIEPLLSGIYSGDIDKMSLMATFPNFYHLEQKHGSLIKGLQNVMPQQSRKERKKQAKKKEGAFFALKNGFGSLVDAIESNLPEKSVVLERAVDHIEKKENHYHVLLSDGTVEKADVVVMTTPHQTIPKIFSQYDFFEPLKNMPATSVANVALAFNKEDVLNDVDGTGYVVSRKIGDYRITACTWTNKKWPGTAPNGKVLLRCYVGRPDDQEVVQLPDDEIVRIVLHDLNKTIKIKNDPLFSVVTRFENVMPQYTVGHVERIEKVRKFVETDLNGIFIAGSSYDGVGVPDCIQKGKEIVDKIKAYLNM